MATEEPFILECESFITGISTSNTLPIAKPDFILFNQPTAQDLDAPPNDFKLGADPYAIVVKFHTDFNHFAEDYYRTAFAPSKDIATLK